jgi:hypothetical protein
MRLVPYRTVAEKIEGLREHIRWSILYGQKHPEEEVLMHAFAASCRTRIIELRMGRP